MNHYTRQVRTRGGVFGAGGYGGGVFDGNESGFGGLSGLSGGSTYEQAAAGIGTVSGLGAAPSLVCTYFPYECKNWDQLSASQQAAVTASAKDINASFQAQMGLYRKEKACDGTQPGRMAGALKEHLIAKGGDPDKMDPDEAVFGPKECAEWWKVFGSAPTVADAKALFGTATVGPLKVTLENVCAGLTITAPSCPKPVVAPPPVTAPPPAIELPPMAPKSGGTTTAWLVGGLLAAAVVGGVAIAASKKKKGR